MIVEKCARQVKENIIEKMAVANLTITKIVGDPFSILEESGTEMMPQGQIKNNVNSHAVGVRCCLRCRYGGDLLQFDIYWFMKIGLRKWNFFDVKEFFFMKFDFKNGYKNEL